MENQITENTNTMNLPMVALRGLLVFPQMTVSIDLEREASVLAASLAAKGDHLVFVCMQKHPEDPSPSVEGLYPIGTVCRVKQMLRQMQQSYSRLIVEGLYRAEMIGAEMKDGCFQAQVAPRPDRKERVSEVRKEAIIRSCLNEFHEYLDLAHEAPGAQLLQFLTQPNEDALAYFIAQNIAVSPDEKQEVLNRYFDTDEALCTFHELAPNIWRFQYNGDEKQLLFELSRGNSLNDPDAVLTVRLLSQKSNNPFVNCVIIIQNVSAGVWKIQTNGGENVVSGTLRVGDSAPASLMSSQDLAFKAEGMFTFFDNKDGQKVPVYMLSTINSPMIYTFRGRPASWWHESSTAPCTIKAGEVTLTATDRNGEGNTAVITVTGENTFNVAIGGVTQPWHL